jgi:Lar family restriction alleviation protein
MSEQALLPCPFCGGVEHEIGYDSAGFDVQCHSWTCRAKTGSHTTEAEAIAAWNRRALATPSTGAVGWTTIPVEPTEAMLLKMMNALHANVPEVDRPASVSDFSDEQWSRVQQAYRDLLAAAPPSSPSERDAALDFPFDNTTGDALSIEWQAGWIEKMEASVERDLQKLNERRLIIGRAKSHLKAMVDERNASRSDTVGPGAGE